MTLNLQTVLIGLGALVVLAVYLISKAQNRAQRGSRFVRGQPSDLPEAFTEEREMESHEGFAATAQPANVAKFAETAQPEEAEDSEYSAPSEYPEELSGTAEPARFTQPAEPAMNDQFSQAEQFAASSESPPSRPATPSATEPAPPIPPETQNRGGFARLLGRGNRRRSGARITKKMRRPPSSLHSPPQSEVARRARLEPLATQPSADAAEDERTPSLNAAADAEAGTYQYRVRSVPGFERLSQIDYWVRITGKRDVGRESILGIYRDSISELSKPSHLHGRRALENKVEEGDWCDVQFEPESARFTDLVLSIQLADRRGALGEEELQQFLLLAERLAECTGRKFSLMTEVENALAQATTLAQFIRHFDTLYTLTLRPRGEQKFTGEAIAHSAEHAELQWRENCYAPRAQGDIGNTSTTPTTPASASKDARATSKPPRYKLVDAGGAPFSKSGWDLLQTREVVFCTRPPMNRAPESVFVEMLDAAEAFAEKIEGVILDPRPEAGDGDELRAEAIHALRESIRRAAMQMAKLGIESGGAEAVRIF